MQLDLCNATSVAGAHLMSEPSAAAVARLLAAGSVAPDEVRREFGSSREVDERLFVTALSRLLATHKVRTAAVARD